MCILSVGSESLYRGKAPFNIRYFNCDGGYLCIKIITDLTFGVGLTNNLPFRVQNDPMSKNQGFAVCCAIFSIRAHFGPQI